MRTLCLLGRYAYGDPARGEGYEYVNFLPSLRTLSSEIRLFDTFDRAGYQDFADLNKRLVQTVIEFKPDLIFAVLMHYEVWTETLDLIRAHTPAAILHWGTDDSWKYAQFSRFIARHVDLHATTYPDVAHQAKRDGLDNVLATQWGADAGKLMPPVTSAECRYDITFVGAAYGNRREWIDGLASRGIAVKCFGYGWDGGSVDTERLHEIYRQSRVSLNFGDSGLQLGRGGLHRSRQIKARTFEVPGAGGLLVTQGADGLDRYFEINKEIVVFDDLDELAAIVGTMLENPARRDAVAYAGYKRVVRDHTYSSRFTPLIRSAQLTASKRPSGRHPLSIDQIEPLLSRHRRGPALDMLAHLMRAAGRSVLGSERGSRAARRALFEVAWRVVGRRTYTAGGWPGRMFYPES